MKDRIQLKLREILDYSLLHDEERIGLLGGKSGIVLLQLTYAKLNKDVLFEQQGFDNLEKIFEQISTDSGVIYTFCSGIAGVGWLLEYMVRQNLLEEDTNEMLKETDDLLGKQIKAFILYNNWDFLHGAVGLGIYFLSRYEKNPAVLRNLDDLLQYLERTVEETTDKRYKWKSVVNIKTREQAYNISLSHGISAIMVLLAKMYKTNIFPKRIENLLQGCVNYIIAQEIEKDKYGSYFPSFAIESENGLTKSRLAWCYGDLGIAMALWQTGVSIHNEEWKNRALKVLLYAAEKRRNLEENSVRDAGLCHGTAGIAHIFYRTWWNTGVLEFKQAADYWFDKTLEMAKFPNGIAGYKTWKGLEYGGWQNDYCLLDGVAGIGLALMSYYTETEPSWDECLLLS